jgi:hypothetical protein
VKWELDTDEHGLKKDWERIIRERAAALLFPKISSVISLPSVFICG